MDHLRQKIHPGLRGALFYAAYWGAIGMFEPFLVLYFLHQGISAPQIGWLAAVLPLCTMILAPLIARLADHLQRRVAILALAGAGFGAALTMPALPAFQPAFATLLGFVALMAVFRSPMIALSDSLITQMAVRRSLDFGAMRLWGSMGFTASAIGLGLVWERTGFATMFLATGLGFIAVVIAALLLDETPRIKMPVEAQSERAAAGEAGASTLANAQTAAGKRRLPLDAGLLFLLGATFLMVAGLFMAGTFGSVYMDELGGSQVMVGALMGMGALGEVPGMLFGGRFARRFGATNTLIIAYIALAVGLAATGLARVPWLLLIFALLRGLGFGLALVGTVTTINTRAPEGFSSTYQGILNAACWGLAPLLGGPTSGWIYETFHAQGLFFTTAAMCLTACFFISPTYRLWKEKSSVPLAPVVE